MKRRHFVALAGAAPLVARWANQNPAKAGKPSAAGSFPRSAWNTVSPNKTGWSESSLENARKFYETLAPANVLIVDRGLVVAQWGDPAQRIKISSMRKSLLSALYGIHVHSGELDLNATVAQLGIDDDPPLTPAEKQATVRMLLEARSGIYHSYVAGTPAMKADQPVRGLHPPGTFWFYNNWDFNALGVIFEQQTHSKIGGQFGREIATPLQMQDFRAEDMYYLHASPGGPAEAKSLHPAYHFRLSARDLALRIPILAARQLERDRRCASRLDCRKYTLLF